MASVPLATRVQTLAEPVQSLLVNIAVQLLQSVATDWITVVYNTESGPLHGTMGTPSDDHVATFGVSLEEAEPYLKTLKKGKKIDAIA